MINYTLLREEKDNVLTKKLPQGTWKEINCIPTNKVEMIGKTWIAYVNNGQYTASQTMSLQAPEGGTPLGFIQRENQIKNREVSQVIIETYKAKEVSLGNPLFKLIFTMRAMWGNQVGLDFKTQFFNPSYIVVESTGHTIAVKLNIHKDLTASEFVKHTHTQPQVNIATYRFVCV